MRLFATKNKVFGTDVIDRSTNPFKANLEPIDDAQSVLFTNVTNETTRNQSRDNSIC